MMFFHFFTDGDEMTKAYLVCDVEKFLQDSYLVPIQQQIEELRTEGTPEIRIKLKDSIYCEGFARYNCHHEYIRKQHGIVYGQEFNYYFEPKDFYLYYSKDKELSLLQAKTEITLDFINHLNYSGYYSFNPIKINFVNMYPLITEITGGWVANLKKTFLKTAAYYGPNVNKSDEFIQAAKIGEVSHLQIKYVSPFSGEELTVGISSKGSVILYDSFERIEDEINIVLSIYETLIKPSF